MPRGKGNHLLHLQTERDGSAVRHQVGNGLAHGQELGHSVLYFPFQTGARFSRKALIPS